MKALYGSRTAAVTIAAVGAVVYTLSVVVDGHIDDAEWERTAILLIVVALLRLSQLARSPSRAARERDYLRGYEQCSRDMRADREHVR